MNAKTINAVIAHVESIDAQVEVLRATLETEALAADQRQYLARCFDLLHIELSAVRSYIEGLQ